MAWWRMVVATVVLLVGMAGGAAAQQGRRVALVVGNSAYRAVGALANPANDARLMARTLGALGFTLIGGTAQVDLDYAAFRRAVQTFGDKAAGADIALFYYAGHGLQVQGTNWLAPVDANPTKVQDLDYEMVDAARVLDQMDAAGAKLNVMILDACRNNPFAGRGLREVARGLRVMETPKGTVISYATQPGNVAADGTGEDSPYTLALAKEMTVPGVDVLPMFNGVGLDVMRATGGRQQPWVAASPIDGVFYFTPPKETPPVVAMVTPAPLPVPVPAPGPALLPTPPLTQSFPAAWHVPETVTVPADRFVMGTPVTEPGRKDNEGPRHEVRICCAFDVGKYPVTFDEWDACVADGGCNLYRPADQGWGRGRRPVINVSWTDAHAYVSWLSGRTRQNWRLLSESEWEYAARARSTTAYWWGAEIGRDNANCDGCGSPYDGKQTSPVGSFTANGFGLYDMLGNVFQWTSDCWNATYTGAPDNGAPWTNNGDCALRVVRGGSWFIDPWALRAGYRDWRDTGYRYNTVGFRVARTLTP